MKITEFFDVPFGKFPKYKSEDDKSAPKELRQNIGKHVSGQKEKHVITGTQKDDSGKWNYRIKVANWKELEDDDHTPAASIAGKLVPCDTAQILD